jgi:hypothetical protein
MNPLSPIEVGRPRDASHADGTGRLIVEQAGIQSPRGR